MPEETELMVVEADYNCFRCGSNGVEELSVVLKRPFATDSGEYELAGEVMCANCTRSVDMSDRDELEDFVDDVDDLRSKIDAKFSQKYEGVTSRFDV